MGRDLGRVGEWLVIHLGQFRHHIESVRAAIGSEEQSGFTDSYVGDSLWDYNFDIEETIKFASMLLTKSPAAIRYTKECIRAVRRT